MKSAKINREWFFRNLWFSYFALVLCWGISQYGEIIRLYRTGQTFIHIEGGSLVITDFVLWYGSALLAIKAGLGPLNLYDPSVQSKNLLEVIRPHIIDNALYYVQYPPHFFAMIKPMGHLSLEHAYIAWCLLALPLILVALFQLSKYLTAPFSRAFFILSGMMSFPTWYAFSIGQTTLYQFPALVAFWLLMRSDKFFLAGLVSILLTVKLQYAPCVVLVGLLLGRWRFLLGFVTSSLIVGLYTMAAIGLQNILVYPKALLDAETGQNVGAPVMQNFRGELLIFHLDVALIHKLSSALFVVTIIGVGLLWGLLYPRMAKISKRRAFDLCVLLTTFLMLVFSVHTHFQDYMAVSIPIALLYSSMKSSGPEDKKGMMLKFLLWGFPLFSWVTLIFLVPLVQLKLQPYFLWALLVIVIGFGKCFDYIKGRSDK